MACVDVSILVFSLDGLRNPMIRDAGGEPSVLGGLKLWCPRHRIGLALKEGLMYYCERGCTFPFVNGIPRFTCSEDYAAAFGLQWKKFFSTQLDSSTNVGMSQERLNRVLGQHASRLQGALVLEAGCGAGRFTELLVNAGARVFACDLSRAVEANYRNIGDRENYFVCQADIRNLPVAPSQFDYVICLGVIQHTPVPEDTIRVLCSHIKRGGMIVIDHYERSAERPTLFRRAVRACYPKRVLRAVFRRSSPRLAMLLCEGIVRGLWPLHRVTWRRRDFPLIRIVRGILRRFSPVHDYQDSYPELTDGMLREWAILDTYDDLTDYYKHGRTVEEIVAVLKQNYISEIVAQRGGIGVEARGVRSGTDEGLDRGQFHNGCK